MRIASESLLNSQGAMQSGPWVLPKPTPSSRNMSKFLMPHLGKEAFGDERVVVPMPLTALFPLADFRASGLHMTGLSGWREDQWRQIPSLGAQLRFVLRVRGEVLRIQFSSSVWAQELDGMGLGNLGDFWCQAQQMMVSFIIVTD